MPKKNKSDYCKCKYNDERYVVIEDRVSLLKKYSSDYDRPEIILRRKKYS
jgi:hypothetical protein